MHRNKTRMVIYTLCRILLGGVFIVASWEKILDPPAFARIIANYQIVPAAIGDYIALFLPWLELVCGVCLIIHRWAQGAACVIAGLMVVFMTALVINMFRGVDVTCGCFTLSDDAPASMWFYLIRDIVLLVMTVGIIRSGQTNPDHRKLA